MCLLAVLTLPVRVWGDTLPGAPPFPTELKIQLQQALTAKGPSYKPRTRHLTADGAPKYTNRLILESSPYLIQHAHNPVNWYPWGDEAFDTARREGKPVLLSVGYSTCHWCHVMEEESFENEEIARYLNEHYIAIKVDREQRPDIDGIYMAAVQTLTGGGGWPMTVWLTPDRQPFYGGTYFPPRDGERGAGRGFLPLLQQLNDLYHQQPDKVAAAAGQITAAIALSAVPSPGSALPTAAVLRDAFAYFQRTFDATNGGFGGAPKFPRPVELDFLLRYHRRSGDAAALNMVVTTLDVMGAGGIYDHIGGGFHRYATDARWRVPHFEKMLYDNALLVRVYLDAYQVTGREDFARIARETLCYVEREMTAPGGGFYSASDADSEGEEGKYFAWTPTQIEAVLGPTRARLITAYYDVTAAGNFHGATILHTPRPLAEVAASLQIDPQAAATQLDAARADLYQARLKRVPPHTDTKVLAAWNGLMIGAFARAAQVLGEPAYARVAQLAADFVLTSLRDGERLRRSVNDGVATGDGYLDDYAFVAAGLLDLYEATFEPKRLEQAIALQGQLEQRFLDHDGGGFFLTGVDHESLLARTKPAYDGAEPAGNSMAVLNLMRLAEFTTAARDRALAEQSLRAFAGVLQRGPASLPLMLGAVDFQLDHAKEIVIVVPSGHDVGALRAPLRRTYVPNRALTIVTEGVEPDAQRALIPWVAQKTAIKGMPTAYVCEHYVCALPTVDPEVFARQLAQVTPFPSDLVVPANTPHSP
ncbi:MAG: thioredoxin domain-containing protein [Deltaproteobacteria bacterium]|nr:thioredoxin domain-containing protein [Deltaproteobacteria bacterium]MBI3390531.1 thioredoxin domain-containing protein [Deltaproteobacteria bacterium]